MNKILKLNNMPQIRTIKGEKVLRLSTGTTSTFDFTHFGFLAKYANFAIVMAVKSALSNV